MILKRYGTSIQSVEINFDAKAMNEIGFRRDRATSIPSDDFDAGWEKLEEHVFAPTAEGSVQGATEQAMLDELEAEIRKLLEGLGDGEALYVESQQGVDYPKTRHDTKTVVEDGENRLHFFARIEPGLRIGHYRKT